MKPAGYDAVVVGAGYGGATCAAVLAERGWSVALIDKNRSAGGKAITVGSNGPRYELWPIAGGPARRSRFDELARLLGLEPEAALLRPERTCEFVYLPPGGGRRSYVVPARAVRDPRAIAGLLAELGVAPRALGGLALLSLLCLLPERLLERLDHTPVSVLLGWLRLPRPLESQLGALMNLLFVVPLDRLPASEALRTLRDFQRGGAGRYHAGGYGALAERAARFVAERGGRFLPSTRVERITIADGRATGVLTAQGAVRARVVISNAGIQPTVLRLVGAAHFPAQYVERVQRLEPSWAFVGVRYQLDARVFELPMTVVFSDQSPWDSARFERARAGDWPQHPLLFVTVPSLWDPALATRDTPQVALIGTLGSPDPDSAMNDEAIRRAERMAHELWPELPRHVQRRESFSARQVSRLSRDAVVAGAGGECIGLGQLIGQCGRSKPSPRSPIAGLYYVGCDAGGTGCGTHQAVDSGFRVAELVLREQGDGELGTSARNLDA
jgi:phytoene dehydrogenase-like protein